MKMGTEQFKGVKQREKQEIKWIADEEDSKRNKQQLLMMSFKRDIIKIGKDENRKGMS